MTTQQNTTEDEAKQDPPDPCLALPHCAPPGPAMLSSLPCGPARLPLRPPWPPRRLEVFSDVNDAERAGGEDDRLLHEHPEYVARQEKTEIAHSARLPLRPPWPPRAFRSEAFLAARSRPT